MANPIRQVRISQRSLSPVEADLLIEVDAGAPDPDLELRGRLVGPTCPYSTTIELSYPLRMLPRAGTDLPLRGRVVIPEPSWWDPISPFLYQGRIEVWRPDALLGSANVRYGLRWLQLRPDGLYWNGKRLMLRAVDRPDLSQSDLLELRRQGNNALILSGGADELWAAAERLGFVTMGRVPTLESRPAAREDSPAFLGWLLPANSTDFRLPGRVLVGIEHAGPSQDEIHFFASTDESRSIVRLLHGVDGELGRIE